MGFADKCVVKNFYLYAVYSLIITTFAEVLYFFRFKFYIRSLFCRRCLRIVFVFYKFTYANIIIFGNAASYSFLI